MAKLLCRLLIRVNLALFANFHITNMSFNAIRENKVLAKISESTVDLDSVISLSVEAMLEH